MRYFQKAMQANGIPEKVQIPMTSKKAGAPKVGFRREWGGIAELRQSLSRRG